jgi:protein TonB
MNTVSWSPLPPQAPPAAHNSLAWRWVALVLALHLLALAALLYRTPLQPQTIEAVHSISVQLVAPVAASAQPAPAPATPKAATPPPAAPKPPPHPTHPSARPLPATAPAPHAQAPAPAAAAASPAAPVTAPAADPQPAPAATLPADTAPKSVERLACAITRPQYSVISRRHGETGTVLIKLIIDASGQIESAVVARSSGFPRLDDAAVQATLQSHCSAHMENGRGVRSAALVPFSFTLEQ